MRMWRKWPVLLKTYFRNSGREQYYMKRFLDIVLSGAGLVILLPFLPLVALLIKLDSRGSVFYRQERVGKDFRPFMIYKFRTMQANAEKEGARITSGGDKRITKFGGFLRKYKIDELPQLFNVLKGDMSFVGPRPEVKEYVQLFEADYRKLLSVRPGITDPAAFEYSNEAVVLGNAETAEEIYINRILPEKIRLSSHYIDNRTVMTDLKLIIMTLFKTSHINTFNTMNMKKEHGDIVTRFSECIMQYRRLFIVLILLMQTAFANYFAFIIRFDGVLPADAVRGFFTYLPVLLLIRTMFFVREGLNKGLWRYASTSDLLKIIKATTLGSVLFLLIVNYLIGDTGYPRSVYILEWMLSVIISGGTRLLIRVFKEYMFLDPSRKKILIIGAGDAGEMIVREMKSSYKGMYEPIGFIDDKQQIGLTIHGVPILGSCSVIPQIIETHKPDEILISVSNDMQQTIREIYELCKPFNVPIKKLPGINDLLDGNVTVGAKLGERLIDANLVTEENVQEALALQEEEGGRLGAKLIKLGHITEEKMITFLRKQYGITHMRPISLEDLLQRETVKTDNTSVMNFIRGKSVIVTGAGGSIGSELCRQIMKYKPSHLLLIDRYENSLYEVDIELRNEGNGIHLSSVIVDIQDRFALEHVFSKHKPQVVFHAAAYKHVPLMEHSPIEAVKNNIFGTKNLIDTASEYGTECFVLVSTDKAVNPTSIMGATKRVAEFLTLHMNTVSKTRYSTVRFGNVLGSNGSVVPIFKEQLKNGGPITVTHPEIERFFMLIPEAVQLVLIAAAAGKGGELFVLDMGKPVRVADFAENFIRLSGFIPHKEIKIKYTGLRPGEKLYEELFDITEKSVSTAHSKLMMAIPDVPPRELLNQHIADLEHAVLNYAADEVDTIIQKIVPNFRNERAAAGKTESSRFKDMHSALHPLQKLNEINLP